MSHDIKKYKLLKKIVGILGYKLIDKSSPPKKKIDNNASKVVIEVIKVLDKVSFIEIFVSSKIFISEIL